MRNSSSGNEDRGNLERLGENAGAMAGRAADFGMEVSGALFRSAAEMLGGWWSTDAPGRAAGAWTDDAERSCQSHFQANAGGGGAAGATQATHAAPKSQHAAMQSAGEVASDSGGGGVGFDAAARVGETQMSGSAHADTPARGSSAAQREGATSMQSATDGFERARPGYQLGYVARQNPAYRGRSFSEVEPELQRVWESRSRTEGGASGSSSTWPEVRGFVDFAYQQGE